MYVTGIHGQFQAAIPTTKYSMLYSVDKTATFWWNPA